MNPRHRGALFLFSFAFGAAQAATPASGGPTEASVKAELQRWRVAWEHGDVRYLEQLLSDDYTNVSVSGEVFDRGATIERAKQHSAAATAATAATSQIVQLHGTVASVHSLTNDTLNGAPVKILHTDDLAFENGRWRVFYSQASVYKNPATVTDLKPLAARDPDKSPSECRQPSNANVGDTLKQLRNGWLEAEIRGNATYLTCLISPDYQDANYRGSARGRDDLIQSSVRRADPNKAIPGEVEQTALVHGDGAVVRNQWSGEFEGHPMKMWLADTFVKRNGVWRAIYSQQSAVP